MMEQRTLAHERVLMALDSGEDGVVDAGLAHVVGQQVVCTLRLLQADRRCCRCSVYLLLLEQKYRY